MDGTKGHHVKGNIPHSERQMSNVFFHVRNLDLKKKMDMNINGGLLGGDQCEMGGKKRAGVYD
jgi:hypothetical protein